MTLSTEELRYIHSKKIQSKQECEQKKKMYTNTKIVVGGNNYYS
jgi:hypothetical protein